MSNPMRKRFSGPDADTHLGTARSLLGSLKNSMSLGGLPAGRMMRTIDGVDYDVMSLFGMDEVRVSVPDPTAPAPKAPNMSETEPVTHDIILPGGEFDTIGVIYIDVFWFVSSLEANEDPESTFEADMWDRMRGVVADEFEKAIGPLDLEDGRMTVVPRFTVISDRKATDDEFTFEGIFTVTPREQKVYAMGMSLPQFRALSKPQTSGAGWSTIDMGNWYAQSARGNLGVIQYVGVILSEIAEQLMWLYEPPQILLADAGEGVMTTPLFPLILIDAGRGYGEDSQNFANYYDDGGRVVKAFSEKQVLSAWYTSYAKTERFDSLSDPDRLPFDIESAFPPLSDGSPAARFFPALITSFGDDAVAVTPDSLESVVESASKWLAESAKDNETICAERGYKDGFGMTHTTSVVDWNVDDVRPFEAIPPLPFEK